LRFLLHEIELFGKNVEQKRQLFLFVFFWSFFFLPRKRFLIDKPNILMFEHRNAFVSFLLSAVSFSPVFAFFFTGCPKFVILRSFAG
jgi:hypothetical protein